MFKMLLRVGIATVALMATVSVDAFAQNKAAVKEGQTRAAAAQDYALLANYKEMVGIIQSTSPGTIKLRVEYDHAVKGPANPNDNNAQQQYQQQLNKLQQQLQAAVNAKSKNPIQTQQNVAKIQAQIAQLQNQHAQQKAAQAAKNVVVVKDHIDFDLRLVDNAPIRRAQPGAEAATDKSLVGAPATFEDLSRGDAVKVYFGPAARTTPTDTHPRVRMVLILKEGGKK